MPLELCQRSATLAKFIELHSLSGSSQFAIIIDKDNAEAVETVKFEKLIKKNMKEDLTQLLEPTQTALANLVGNYPHLFSPESSLTRHKAFEFASKFDSDFIFFADTAIQLRVFEKEKLDSLKALPSAVPAKSWYCYIEDLSASVKTQETLYGLLKLWKAGTLPLKSELRLRGLGVLNFVRGDVVCTMCQLGKEELGRDNPLYPCRNCLQGYKCQGCMFISPDDHRCECAFKNQFCDAARAAYVLSGNVPSCESACSYVNNYMDNEEKTADDLMRQLVARRANHSWQFAKDDKDQLERNLDRVLEKVTFLLSMQVRWSVMVDTTYNLSTDQDSLRTAQHRLRNLIGIYSSLLTLARTNYKDLKRCNDNEVAHLRENIREGIQTKEHLLRRIRELKAMDRRSPDSGTLPLHLQVWCVHILKGLLTHEHGWVFSAPVDPVALQLGNYFDIIKRPMDLGTILTKLEKDSYHTLEDFRSDVCLTFENAMKYNAEGTVVHGMAKVLMKKFEADFKENPWVLLRNEYNSLL